MNRAKEIFDRAAVIFRDHGKTLYRSYGGVSVKSGAGLPAWADYGTSAIKTFRNVTAAFDHFCPLIASDDFTSRMIELLKDPDANKLTRTLSDDLADRRAFRAAGDARRRIARNPLGDDAARKADENEGSEL